MAAKFYQSIESGSLFNSLIEDEAGVWMISYERPAAPFFVSWRLMKAVDILWDVDDLRDLTHLPKEVEIPSGMTDLDEISDYLSDVTEFCHRGFRIEL